MQSLRCRNTLLIWNCKFKLLSHKFNVIKNIKLDPIWWKEKDIQLWNPVWFFFFSWNTKEDYLKSLNCFCPFKEHKWGPKQLTGLVINADILGSSVYIYIYMIYIYHHTIYFKDNSALNNLVSLCALGIICSQIKTKQWSHSEYESKYLRTIMTKQETVSAYRLDVYRFPSNHNSLSLTCS